MPRIYEEKKNDEEAKKADGDLKPTELPPCKSEGGAFMNSKGYKRSFLILTKIIKRQIMPIWKGQKLKFHLIVLSKAKSDKWDKDASWKRIVIADYMMGLPFGERLSKFIKSSSNWRRK